jgi:hypothetical protein
MAAVTATPLCGPLKTSGLRRMVAWAGVGELPSLAALGGELICLAFALTLVSGSAFLVVPTPTFGAIGPLLGVGQ